MATRIEQLKKDIGILKEIVDIRLKTCLSMADSVKFETNNVEEVKRKWGVDSDVVELAEECLHKANSRMVQMNRAAGEDIDRLIATCIEYQQLVQQTVH